MGENNQNEVEFTEYFDILTSSENEYETCSDQLFSSIRNGDR